MSIAIKRFEAVKKVLTKRKIVSMFLNEEYKNIDYQKAIIASETIRLIISEPNKQ